MIDILLAVYNGEEFLAEQIDSILAQTNTDWRLLICDDCSTDGSYDIAVAYAKANPYKVVAYKNPSPSGSPQANFCSMLKLVRGEYVMFCDHDDVWLPDKVELTYQKMKEMEETYGNVPLMVHTELQIVDAALHPAPKTFSRYQGLNNSYNTLNRLLVQNNITGCTVMMNRKLLELVWDASPDQMLMHDWWFALAASAFGHIGFIEKPLILYRQHGTNQLGAINNRSLVGAAKIVAERKNTDNRVKMTFVQAQHFLDFYKDILPEEALNILHTYLEIPRKPKLGRIRALLKGRYLKQNFLTAVGGLIFS